MTGSARRAGLVALTLTVASCSSSFGMPRGSTEQGRGIFDLWQVFFWAGIVVAALVYGLIGWSLVRYRRRRRDDDDVLGRAFHANVPLEVVYTSIPVAIVIVLFMLSFGTEDRASSVSPTPDVTLRAEAFSWGWRFTYPDEGVEVVSEPSGEGVPGPEIVLPLGATTRIELTSNDVIHAFWVPDFLYKRDAIPGRVNVFDVTPTDLGAYHGVCSEFCGLHHAFMTFTVRVVPPGEFEAWLTSAGATS
jgi:cytochrome c oxidase subunit 2